MKKMKNSVKELIEKRNEIEAQIWAIEKGITIENEVILHQEITNLIDGVGEGFVSGDYYADSRLYSDIPGVKNIRFHTDTEILVKVVSPIGMLVPHTLNVRGVEYRISLSFSSKYREGIDY